MNRVFKTKWSVAHQEYVVTDEKHTTKTKSTKSAVALAVAAMMFAAGTASASFVDTSFVADNPFVFQQAKKSFETAEYQKNWGLSAMKASSAYALGYHGQGVKVGMMDSGFLTTHQELSGDRWHTVKAEGNYSQSGERYPQYAYGSKPKDPVKYNKGDKFSVDGAYNPDFNDNHGTGCAGVYAGNRDGVGMHGVAWGSEFYSANTGGTDDTNYGPFPDYNFFKAGYDALVASGVKIINNSFGTNLKQVDENGNILDYYHSGPELTTVNDIEYEYFLFKKQYNNNDADPELKGSSRTVTTTVPTRTIVRSIRISTLKLKPSGSPLPACVRWTRTRILTTTSSKPTSMRPVTPSTGRSPARARTAIRPTRPATTSMAATAARPWLLRSSPAPLVFWPPVIRT